MKKLALAIVAFFSGGFGLTKALVVEVLTAIVGRIAWKIVLERFLTRVLVACLVRLKNLNTNQIYQGTIESIIKQLNERGLSQATLKQEDKKPLKEAVEVDSNNTGDKKNE